VGISGNKGIIASSSSSLFNILGANLTSADQEGLVRWSVDSTSATAGILLRAQNSANYYMARYGGTNTIQFRKVVGGTGTSITAFSFTPAVGSFYRMRFRVSGSTIAIKVWQDGTTEPATWGYTTTDTSLSAPGGVGLYGFASTATNNTFDSFTVMPPSSVTPTPTPAGTATNTPLPTPTNTTAPSNTPTTTPLPTPTGSPTATSTPTVVLASGAITGTITDSSSGIGLQNVQVVTDTGGYSAITDQNGNFTMPNVAGGRYNVTAAAPGYNSTFQGNVTVTSSTGSSVTLTLGGVPLGTSMDTYNRYNQPGWGTASDGHIWKADFNVYPLGSESVASTQGFVDAYTAQTDLDNWMGASYADQEVSADFTYTAVGQDNFLHGPRLLARMSDEHHYIDFAINVTTGTLALWVNNNENWIQVSSTVTLHTPFNANTLYHSKLDVVGTSVKGKVWAAGTAEPGWMVTATQNTLNMSNMGGVRTTYASCYWQNFAVTSLTNVAGTVTDTSGQPIGGATVSTNTGYTTTTNSQGAYVLPVAAAAYTVTASAPGYTASSQSATVSAGSTVSRNFQLS
jgi:Carboxypeptidase regulatory-like domain